MRRLLPLLGLLAASTAAAAVPTPKLIVAVSVDQFSADLFAEYRATFTGGLKRLAEGVVFPAGYQSHATTETCPGHSTILTGSRPARTGIVANDWFDQGVGREDKRVYCMEDESAPGSTSRKYRASTIHLKVPTLGDRLKARDPASRVVSVAGKDRAALLLGGHDADQVWFWDDKSGFRTLEGVTAAAPAEVAAANARVGVAIGRPERAAVPPRCDARLRPVRAGAVTVGGAPAREAGDVAAFRASPAFDSAVADLAITLMRDLRLGQRAATDLLAIGLSATDYVGHGYGTEGVEMCAQLAGLDATLGRLLAALDATGVGYAVVLTADHGGTDVAERVARTGWPDSHRADRALGPEALDEAARAVFGLRRRVIYADATFSDVYVADDLPAALRPRVLAWVAARLRANPDVLAVFERGEIARPAEALALPPDVWPLADRVRAGFDPARSGNLYVVLKPGVSPIATPAKGYVATHGSPWNRDRRVPILFWWPGMAGFEQPLPVETVDILPTLAPLVGLPIPSGEIDGRCLDLDPGTDSSCPK